MPNLATSWLQTHPSFMEPDFVVNYNQASGAFDALSGGNPRVKIGGEDKQVYIKTLNLSSKVSSSASWANSLPSASIILGQMSFPTYLNRARAQYDHHDTAQMGIWGVSVVEAQRLAMRQGHFQHLRYMLLKGNLPGNGEGLLNTNGATSVNLPQDSFGNTSVRNYDNGQMAQFFLSQLLATKARTYQLGQPSTEFTVLGPQRTLGQFEYNIVQLTSYQRPGGGTDSTKGTFVNVAGLNGDTIKWVYDDTLQNQSSAGVDTVLIVMPELQKPKVMNPAINTNAFAELTPSMGACTLMYTDMAAPREIPTPIVGGAIDVVTEIRASPGIGVRPEAITVVLMTY
jgi:hypothetical protein